jgi:galactokinase
MERFAGTSASENVRRAVKTGQMAFGSGWGPDRVAIAPGRIELIGNHIDYNGGPVLAAAIDRFVAVAASTDPGNAATLRAIAADAPDEGVVALDSRELTGWRNAAGSLRTFDYARGLLAAMQERESPLSPRLPASSAIAGDVPIGLGLSSSAALCVALALALAAGMRTDRELVLLAQEAEHRAGTPCGTMDQSASVAGGVIAFDGASLGVEQISPALGDLVFVVADSGIDRSLGASSYPARVAESREALEMARKALGVPIPHLAAVTPQQLIALDQMGVLSPHLMRRLRHIVAEALAVDGVLGARMMGGGEGGTALILLPAETLPHLDAALRSGYYRKRGMAEREGLLTRCAFAPGATLIEESVQLDQH